MDSAVQLRLIADVPVACFLSGGIDSSVITALAARHTTHLNTFSVGFKDAPLYDETPYALAVAKQYNTKHTVFQLSQTDLYQHLDEMLNTLDEPFADSSALAVYLLSKHTAKQVKVALSGDGGDELFAGYNKHAAEYQMYYGGIKANLVKWLHPLWQTLPQRRDTKLGNLIRQLGRFSAAAQLTPAQRYQQWASFGSVAYAQAIVKQSTPLHLLDTYTAHIGSNQPITDVLKADIQLVLEGDMLRKVDLMSMANSLEVRTPFLDYRVVNFAFSLPDSYKIANTKLGGLMKKRIVQDAFRHLLPPQIYNRPKHGFEVPITHWLQTDLKPLLLNDLLQKDFIEAQNIFYYPAIEQLLNRLFSNNPADAPMQVWALVVFQWWWKRHCQ
jgi:asparagine synthase (glutamine-hydrolysing)